MVTPLGQTPAATIACITIFSPRLLQSYSPATGFLRCSRLISFHNGVKEAADVLLLLRSDSVPEVLLFHMVHNPTFSIFLTSFTVSLGLIQVFQLLVAVVKVKK